MGNAIIKMKLMPGSPETNLEEIKNSAKEIIEKNQGKIGEFSEELIAFGLKAVIVSFMIPESQELEPIESELEKVENINSVQVIDMRREFG